MYPGTHAAVTPDKPAVVMAGGRETVTYRELDEGSARLARLLYDRGLREGDVLALLAENHIRYTEVLWAAMRSGLHLTAINRHATAEEAAYILRDAGAAALVATHRLAHAACDAVRGTDCRIRLMIDGTADGFEPYEKAVAAYPGEPPSYQPRGEMMLYSSGTTGRPKGIRRPLLGLDVADPTGVRSAAMCRRVAGMDRDAVYLCPAPLYHAGPLGWVRGVHELGATLVVMEKFDAEGMLAVIERERVTHLQAVPTMLIRLLKLPARVRGAYDLSSLRTLVHAGAPCPVDAKRELIDWLGPIVTEYYSATEGIGTTVATSEEWLAHPGTVGRPILGTPRICGPDGGELPAGATGSVYFARDAAPFEYHNDPAKTRSARHPHHEHWYSTGDLGYLDDDGYLFLTDRSAFTIISGGVNIYPAEIEARMVLHPDVADVAVFGLPDDEMGEYVHAVVQPAEGVRPTPELAEELRTFVRQHLAGPKVPRIVDFRARLPRLDTGKLYKLPLRQAYLDRAASEARPHASADSDHPRGER
ncbi:acyl-CoA synthetase [Yinghuangia sp. ASG 101]|uniref:acyl-CoA synthetase n=1 Tax=Yinghuangia sp. ASG 101 TaxID=2896848 RepID=UPI001E53CDA3|nr:acyl-CoA synthetase [Yinghuangia sp. ASG 101]UGQ11949.1 acyl-CoA synthetase [Yinghuangia sp. ASG 101]